MTTCREILAWCDDILQTAQFKDYAPNGLQIEGAEKIEKIVAAVTASRAAVECAAQQGAQLLLVHHGMFWKSEPATITGWKKQRIATLLHHNINMAGYHLPLDAHPELGNNAQLALRLGWQPTGRFGEQQLGWLGEAAYEDGQALADHLAQALQRPPIAIYGPPAPIRKLAWCSGGAQGFFEGAIAAGADAFITGEISEPQAHLARECGVAFYACGHHATERYGAPTLAAHVAHQLGLAHEFIEIDNPA